MLTPSDRTTLKLIYSMMLTDFKRKHPDNPYPSVKGFKVEKTNDLERAICKWFELYGYKAERVKVQGRKIGSDTVYHNPITGKVQIIEKAKYAPTTGAKGSADISATCMDKEGHVMSLRIEVKNIYTKDVIRPDQIKYKQEHEASGGTYIIVRCISEFVQWFEENVKKNIFY